MTQKTELYCDIQDQENEINKKLIKKLKEYSIEKQEPIYLLRQPLGNTENEYTFKNSMILLIPDVKIILVKPENSDKEEFEDFTFDFKDDLIYFSKKYGYTSAIGKSRKWKDKLITIQSISDLVENFEQAILNNSILEPKEKREIELLISLLTGSINSIDRVGNELPENKLDLVKKSIVLFDSDQTRFIFNNVNDKKIVTQGIAGAGKTELLLHKLKELYTGNSTNRIAFTCYNKSLASSLIKRVPEFFDFMKVPEQIKWEERLWIMHSWGSIVDKTNKGLYALICENYGIPFFNAGQKSFDNACKSSLEYLNEIEEIEPLFDYILIDESQDFQQSFFDLCDRVTGETIFIVGDIFQNIFLSNNHFENPNFLLNKCYRTPPETLMIAQSIGFGLFEDIGIRKLTEDDWKICGYNIDFHENGKYRLSRSSLRKFKNLPDSEVNSTVKLVSSENIIDSVLDSIEEIKAEYPNVKPEDIAVVSLDKGKQSLLKIRELSYRISNRFKWLTNELPQTRKVEDEKVTISNINHIKGLEFPFVICYSSQEMGATVKLRNAVYMSLTRSYITSYLILDKNYNESFIDIYSKVIKHINETKLLEFDEPKSYIDESELSIDYLENTFSQKDILEQIFEELNIQDEFRDSLTRIVGVVYPDSLDKKRITELIKVNYGQLC